MNDTQLFGYNFTLIIELNGIVFKNKKRKK